MHGFMIMTPDFSETSKQHTVEKFYPPDDSSRFPAEPTKPKEGEEEEGKKDLHISPEVRGKDT